MARQGPCADLTPEGGSSQPERRSQSSQWLRELGRRRLLSRGRSRFRASASNLGERLRKSGSPEGCFRNATALVGIRSSWSVATRKMCGSADSMMRDRNANGSDALTRLVSGASLARLSRASPGSAMSSTESCWRPKTGLRRYARESPAQTISAMDPPPGADDEEVSYLISDSVVGSARMSDDRSFVGFCGRSFISATISICRLLSKRLARRLCACVPES